MTIDRIAAQFPKPCGCGLEHTNEGWTSLVWAYDYVDAFAEQEARHCPCGSTLQILTHIIDPSEE